MERIEQKQIAVGEDGVMTIYTVLEGRYRIWKDDMDYHRWCVEPWRDDGIGGIPSHGKALTIEKAIEACKKNDAIRKEIYGD